MNTNWHICQILCLETSKVCFPSSWVVIILYRAYEKIVEGFLEV